VYRPGIFSGHWVHCKTPTCAGGGNTPGHSHLPAPIDDAEWGTLVLMLVTGILTAWVFRQAPAAIPGEPLTTVVQALKSPACYTPCCPKVWRGYTSAKSHAEKSCVESHRTCWSGQQGTIQIDSLQQCLKVLTHALSLQQCAPCHIWSAQAQKRNELLGPEAIFDHVKGVWTSW
jgi:hypothetical protein